MAEIYHLTEQGTWDAAVAAGEYTMSTRATTLAEEGYIHASYADQVRGVADRYYSDVTELLLLVIDTFRLEVPVVPEPAARGRAEKFPHIYGPVPISAVTEVRVVLPDRSNLPE
ncbi:DUF952 domain-containing protein [Longispora albida]|uniref:DUF952 domain-containing protein n=1 Tax=Longispora albida TaxID=203523 RepID=UPI0003664F6C|nr:DUF952 domain-containing protein [Longispora albida]